MSKDKNKSEDRRKALLWRAHNARYGIVFHREGGMAMSNPDVRRLVKDGMLVFRRGSSEHRFMRPLSPKKFVGNFMADYRWPDPYIHGRANVTFGVITDKGRELIGATIETLGKGDVVEYEVTGEAFQGSILEMTPIGGMANIQSFTGRLHSHIPVGKLTRVSTEQ